MVEVGGMQVKPRFARVSKHGAAGRTVRPADTAASTPSCWLMTRAHARLRPPFARTPGSLHATVSTAAGVKTQAGRKGARRWKGMEQSL